MNKKGTKICVREINENIRRCQLGEPLTKSLKLLNGYCNFKKAFEEKDKIIHSISRCCQCGKEGKFNSICSENCRRKRNEYHRKYWKKHSKNPEVKERIKKYQKEYNKRPGVKERIRKYRKEYNKKYYQLPEVKSKIKKYESTEKVKIRRKNYYQKKEIKKKVKLQNACRYKTKLLIRKYLSTNLIDKCKDCFKTLNLQIHHEVYPDKKKEIIHALRDGKIYYLCRSCHGLKNSKKT